MLIDIEGNLSLIDFGLANLYGNGMLDTYCGSLLFASPEIIKGCKYIGPEVDMWSIGVVMYILACGKFPFLNNSIPALHKLIINGFVDYPAHLSPDCKDLLSNLLKVDPKRRATLSFMKNHEFLKRKTPELLQSGLFRSKTIAHSKVTSLLPVHLDNSILNLLQNFGFGGEAECALIIKNQDSPHPAKSIYALILNHISEIREKEVQNETNGYPDSSAFSQRILQLTSSLKRVPSKIRSYPKSASTSIKRKFSKLKIKLDYLTKNWSSDVPLRPKPYVSYDIGSNLEEVHSRRYSIGHERDCLKIRKASIFCL